jgi:transcriptional regulator with XRE-family HTH domain
LPRKPFDPIDVYVGQKLRTRRHALYLSQTKLATSLGLSFQRVQKYENGANRMGTSRLVQVASFLKVPVDHFFDGAPDHSKVRGSAPSTAYIAAFLPVARVWHSSKHSARSSSVAFATTLCGWWRSLPAAERHRTF